MYGKLSPNEIRIVPRYKEVDSMHVVHHSNHIVWMEEARFAFLKNVIGISYKKIEEMGFYLPIVKIEAKYNRYVKLDEELIVRSHCKIVLSGYFEFTYQMVCENELGKIVFKGMTKHVFMDTSYKMKLQVPDYYWEMSFEAQKKFPKFISVIANA